MRELKGEKDLQLAKDVLCAFEIAHYPNEQACRDIQEGLYWFEAEYECFSADLGQILRGESEEVRIFEIEETSGWLTDFSEGLDLEEWAPVAFIKYQEKIYIFYI